MGEKKKLSKSRTLATKAETNLAENQKGWFLIGIGLVLIFYMIFAILLSCSDVAERDITKKAALEADNKIRTKFLNNVEDYYQGLVTKHKEKKYDEANNILSLFKRYNQMNYKDVLELEKKTNAEMGKKRKEQQKEAVKLAKVFMKSGRENIANELEKRYLSNGMDVRITLSGPEKTIMRMEYVLMSRPLIYKITNETDFLQNLKTLGFKKVIFTDGYYHSWTYTLAK
jgi:hypothetical protein